MGEINMNPTNGTQKPDEIKDVTGVTPAQTAPTGVEPPVNQTEPPKGVSEPPTALATQTASGKHNVIYLANGTWTDREGQKWTRDEKSGTISHKTFTAEELAKRPDIQYMVAHGAMKDIPV